jgi:hypothetical protein
MVRGLPLRTALGFLIAPAAAAAVIPIWWAFRIWPIYGADLALRSLRAYFEFAVLVGYSATILLGLPLYMMLRMFRWCSAIIFLGASYLVGIAWPVAIFIKNGPPLPDAAPISHYLIWWGGSGTVGGLILWLIDRPDLRISNASTA